MYFSNLLLYCEFCECLYECKCPQKPDMPFHSGAGVIGGCESPDMGVGHQTCVLLRNR